MQTGSFCWRQSWSPGWDFCRSPNHPTLPGAHTRRTRHGSLLRGTEPGADTGVSRGVLASGESCLVGRVLAPLRQGTWIGLIIRLDVDLALGQHLGKLPLQLLELGVVRDNVNRSTESVQR